jgi:hypothetical protein
MEGQKFEKNWSSKGFYAGAASLGGTRLILAARQREREKITGGYALVIRKSCGGSG